MVREPFRVVDDDDCLRKLSRLQSDAEFRDSGEQRDAPLVVAGLAGICLKRMIQSGAKS